MAKIETNEIVGSSQYNWLIFDNSGYEKPFVTFRFASSGNTSGTLTISDALDEDGYSKVISFSPTLPLSDSSFTSKGSAEEKLLALGECLRLNNVFFDSQIVTDQNNQISIKAYLDRSTRFDIVSSSNDLVVGGTYSGYYPSVPNKFVLIENSPSGQITMEKYSVGTEVGFNITAPYEHLSFKDPILVRLLAYKVDGLNITRQSIIRSTVTVFPTTLSKFSDVDIYDYFYQGDSMKVDFLTNLKERDCNDGEDVCLSVMSNTDLTLLKKYYTIGGQYLGSDDVVARTENYTNRIDFYWEMDLEQIEWQTNKQVGYVDVVAVDSNVEVTNPVRFNIVPKCNKNNSVYFVNELGGIDSFNFQGERIWSFSIDDQSTYKKNPVRPFGRMKEIESVGQKIGEITHQVKTTIIGEKVAKWLGELGKSKYVFIGDAQGWERVIVERLDIDVTDRSNTFEVEMTFRNGDNYLKI